MWGSYEEAGGGPMRGVGKGNRLHLGLLGHIGGPRLLVRFVVRFLLASRFSFGLVFVFRFAKRVCAWMVACL